MRMLIALLAASMPLLSQSAPRPKILGVAHIGLYVSDIGKSRAFYHDLLGFEEAFGVTNPDGKVSMTFVKINDNQYIELFPTLKPGQDRLAHIAFYTDDAEAMHRYLTSRGVAAPPNVAVGRVGNAQFKVKDPDGHEVEFLQYLPASKAAQSRGRFMGPQRASSILRHVGILVGNLDAALKFYSGILGCDERWRGSSDGKFLSWVNMKVPDGDDYVEFMLYRELPPPDRRGSVHHLCLETPDVPKALAELETRPGRKAYARPLEWRTGTNRRRLANLFDPDGTRSELMEPKTVDGEPAPWSKAPAPTPAQ